MPTPPLPRSPYEHMAIDMSGQPTLFDVEVAAAPTSTSVEPTGKRSATKASTPKGARWSTIGGRQRCDVCLVEALNDPLLAIQPARMRRVAEDTDDRLCYEHARPIRAADEAAAEAAKAKKQSRTGSAAAAWNSREDSTWLDRM